jgi:hypothetical protein
VLTQAAPGGAVRCVACGQAPALVEAVRVFAAGGYTLATTAGGGGLTYKDAGVDIDEGERLVDLIKPIVKETLRPVCAVLYRCTPPSQGAVPAVQPGQGKVWVEGGGLKRGRWLVRAARAAA